MNKAISTGGAVGLTAGVFKAAIGAVVMLAAWCGLVMTPDQAADIVTLTLAILGVWLHSSSSTPVDHSALRSAYALGLGISSGPGYAPSDPPIVAAGAEIPPTPSNK